MLNVTNLVANGSGETDDTSAAYGMTVGTLTKSIYAVNGNRSFASPVNVRPGDTLTYRLRYSIPSGDVENLRLYDYLPLPVFRAGDPDANGGSGPSWVFEDVISASTPVAGHAKYGTNETFRAIRGSTPTVSVVTNAGNNTLVFDYGTYSHVANNGPYHVDILFTVVVSTDPFADALFLTNQAESREQNTAAAVASTAAIIQIVLNEPHVDIFKGVVGSTKTGGKVVSGIAFGAPGNAAAFTAGSFTTVAQSTAIAAEDLITGTLPDAGDKVRYAAALQNTGRSDAFDVRFFDTIPPAYAKPVTTDAAVFATQINLIVQRGGSLTALTYGTDYIVTWDQPGGKFTVELVDNYNAAPGLGGLNRGYDSGIDAAITDGSNGVIITYDLTVASSTAANTTIPNTATLSNYAGAEGAVDFTAQDQTESATVKTALPTFVKAVTGTEFNVTGNGQFQAVIGEKVTYTLTVTVPEGRTPAAQVVDTLDQGLAFVGLVSTTPSVGVTVANNPATVTILDVGVARSIRFTLGDVQNNNTGNSGADRVTLVFEAIVLNQNTLPVPNGNQAGTSLNNTAQFTATGVAAINSTPAQTVTLVEPTLTLTKQIAPDSGGVSGVYANTLAGSDAGNVLFYKIAITHAGAPAAFDLALTDAFPAKLAAPTIYSAVSTLTTVGGVVRSLAPADFLLTGNTLTFAAGLNVDLAGGGTITVEVRASAGSSVVPGESINNTATIAWTSLDGDYSAQRTPNNASSTERSGAGGPGTDTILNNYAAVNTAGTGRLTIASPVLNKIVAATSEIHTLGNQTLADFNGTGFSGLTGSWVGNVTVGATAVRIAGTATENGGGYIDYGAVRDLRGYATLGVVLRALTGNNATPLRIRIRDTDGTIQRFDLAASPTAGAPRFSYLLLSNNLLTPNAIDAVGTTPGLNLAAIDRISLDGDGTGANAARLEIDGIVALRTLVVPGEIVRYRLVAEIPEGTSSSLELRDRLPPGLRFINDDKVRVAFLANGGGITSSTDAGSVPALGGPATAGLNYIGSETNVSDRSLLPSSGSGLAIGEGTAFDLNVSASRNAENDTYTDGTDVYFKLGSVVNLDSDADAEFVIVEFNALVENVSGSQAGVSLLNDFEFLVNGFASGTAAATSSQTDFSNLVVVEPRIDNLAKTLTATPVDAGDPVVYQLKFSNNSAHLAQYAPQVRVATTASFVATFNATGGSGGAGRYTGAPLAVDGVTLVEGDRILVKNQTTAAQNGIYKVVDAANGVWDRASDFDTAAELTLGYRAYVSAGTANGGRTFALDAAVATINVTALAFSAVAVNPAVGAATVANVAGTFTAGPPTTITGIALTGGNLPIDGVNVAVGDRVLLKNQTTSSQNGIYTVTGLSGTASLTRAADFDASAEAVLGLQTYVTAGILNGGRTFAHSTTAAVTLNTTSLAWAVVEPVTAFDLVLTDSLPADVLFQSLTVTTPSGTDTRTNSGAIAAGSVTVPAVGASGTVTINLDSLAPELRIAGTPKDVTITVSGVVAAAAAARRELSNTARLTFTSLPGGKGTASNPTGTDPTTSGSVDASGGQYGERNGSGVTATDNTPVNYNTTQLNNYSVGATVSASLARPTVDKSFKNGSLTEDDTSLASTIGANGAIGEQITYDILVTLPEGSTPDVVVNDIVPAGLRVDSYSVIVAASGSSRLSQNFNGTLTSNPPNIAPALPVSGASTVSFSFGACSATADGNAANNAFVLRLNATVLNVVGNQQGTTLANTATLRFDDPALADRIVADANAGNDPVVTVVEPALFVDKAVPGGVFDAGDLITYTFTISNSGSQAAYDVTLNDPLPAVVQSPQISTLPGDFTAGGFYSSSVVAASTANVTGFAGGAFTGAPTALDGVALANGDRVLVKDQAAPAENGIYVVVNAAVGNWSRATDFDQAAEITVGYRVRVAGGVTQTGFVYSQTATVVTVNTDPLAWALYAGSSANSAVVAATTANVAGFAGGAFAGASAALDGVTLVNGDRILVKDQTAPAQNGIYIVDNAAVGNWSRATDFDQTAEITVVYRVRVAGGSTQAGRVYRQTATVATVNADPVVWQLDSGLVAPTVNDFEIVAGTFRSRASFSLDIPPNGSITLKVTGTVGSNYTPGQVITNAASLQWTSLQDPNGEERTGGGGVNDYTTADTVSTVAGALSGAKSLFSTDRTETSGSNVTIGEQITYALKVTLPEGATPNLTVTDVLPAGLQYASYQLITTRAGSQNAAGTYLLDANLAGTVPAPVVSGGVSSGDDATFTFGAIGITGDNIVTNNAFLVLVTARVLDVVGNVGFAPPGQTVLANSASFDVAGDGRPPIVVGPLNVTVVEPRMSLGKNILQARADATDVLTVVLTVTNSGTSVSYDTIVRDVLNTNHFNVATLNTGVVGVDYPIGFTTFTNITTGELRYQGGSLANGTVATFRFQVALTAGVLPGAVSTNLAAVTQATTLGGTVAGERDEPDVQAQDTVRINASALRGFTYLDVDNDGVFDVGETPIAGVTVQLSGTDFLGNPVSRTTTTDGTGFYGFGGLRPGSYTVTETQPVGYLDGKETAGTPFGGSVNNGVESQAITSVVIPLGSDQAGVDYNFGELRPSSLAGSVYLDVNRNGVLDGGDTGLGNVTVTLTGTDDRGAPVSSALLSLVNGTYVFQNLRPGTYTISETQPSLYNDGQDAAGTAGGTVGNDVVSAISLTQNQNGTGYNFGEMNAGVIGDRVWLDEDADGVQDAGESGIANVTVTVRDTNNVTIATTTTDAEGRYLFTGMPVGTFTVLVNTSSMAAGLAANQTYDPDATVNNQTTVTLTLGQVVLTADFGYNWAPTSDVTGGTNTGAIGDRVWVDADGDGRQDPGEPGLGGVTVSLLVDSNGDGVYGGAGDAAAVTTVTAADGSYIFDGLVAGGYVVQVTAPGSYTQTGDPDATLDNKTTAPIVLAPGDVFVNADFGYRPTAGTTGTVSGTVWMDANVNQQGPAGTPGGTDTEPVIPSVTVALIRDSDGDGVWDAGEPIIATTQTDASGSYAFPGLAVTDGAGTDDYLVWANDTGNVLAGHAQTYDANGTGTPNVSAASNLAVAGNDLQDFGYTAAGQTASTGLIGDTVYLDRDGNGSQDLDGADNVLGTADDEPGLEGVIVQLWNAGETTLLALAVTDENGRYAFGGLGAATYVVKVTTLSLPGAPGDALTNTGDPDGGGNSKSSVTLVAGQINLLQDFGYRDTTSPNTIGGTIWVDTNADGTLSGESGRYAGVTVVLRNSAGNIVGTAVTDASGNYSFPGLPDGTYTVDVTDTANVLNGAWKSTGPTPGADNNSQGDPYTVTVGNGQTDTTGDFGYYRSSASVGNRTWRDVDSDGIQDVGEVGVANVLLKLTVVYANGVTSTVYTVSDATGLYTFGNLMLDENFTGVTNVVGQPTSYALSVVSAPVNLYMTRKWMGADRAIDSDNTQGTFVNPVRGVNNMELAVAPGTEPVPAWVDFGFSPTPTLVVVSGFRAFARDGQVVVAWETATELGTIGFYLERRTADGWQRVNPELLPADFFTPLPHVYELPDPAAEVGGTYTWRLIELDNRGLATTYGPWTVTVDGPGHTYEAWAGALLSAETAERQLPGADPDGDGLTNFEEFLAGTSPLDANSVLRVRAVKLLDDGNLVLTWPSVSNKLYAVELATTPDGRYLPFSTAIGATPPANAATVRVDRAAAPRMYFRVIVQ